MLSFPTWVEIDLDAFKWNLDRIRDILSDRVNILLVVKADAYGHGAVRISKFASGCGVNMLGVATIDEGVQLRKAGIKLPILILSPILKDQIGRLIEYDLSASVSTYEFARAASGMAISKGKKCTVHIEVDTGMGRAGLPVAKTSDFALKISQLEGLVLEGLFTHFPAADSDVEYTSDQINLFSEIVDYLKSKEVTFKYIHSANSAAIINFPESHFNMVRPGLLAYGHTPSVDLRDKIDIRPVMNFKTKLLLAREVLSGESISYGRTYITEKPTIIGTIAAGYGHGMSHRLSNKGEVLFRGRRVPIVGRVTMDMTMVDLYGFEDPRVGEEVVIFGRQGNEEITVDETAQWDGTLNYEVLCRINKRVVRVYIKSGKIDTLKTLQGLHENI
ncbi:MAG TPA: alanine racemase [Candidatus Krumholzibacteriaceae bacterium]|nr:alanine racemase [Candidatus Krumholzibacteriaceae bacterium]